MIETGIEQYEYNYNEYEEEERQIALFEDDDYDTEDVGRSDDEVLPI